MSQAVRAKAGLEILKSPNFRDVMIFLVLAIIGLVAGFAEIQSSVYRSPAQVFQEFLNGPDRILFPLVVAVVAGFSLSAELSNRFIASTRTREDARKRLARFLFSAASRVFIGYVFLVALYATASFLVVPMISPHSISPLTYGLNGVADAFPVDFNSAPLSGLVQHGWLLFAAVSAVWTAAHAVIFALVAFLSVLLIERTVLALAVPMLVYIGESAVFQLAGLPAQSFLISAMYPAGLQNYDLAQSLIPALVLGSLALAGSIVLIFRSRSSPRLS